MRQDEKAAVSGHPFMVDVLCTVSRHKVANLLLSYVYMLYLFSSIGLSMIDRKSQFTTDVRWYDYIYLVVTGSFLNSGVDATKVVVAFAAIYTLCISITVLILALILMRSRLAYPSMKNIFIGLWFYVIPILGPLANNAFSRSYSVLSIETDTAFFGLIVLANAVHLIPVFCSAFVNTVSAYDIDHISCANNPVQGVVVQVSLLLSHQLLGFLDHSLDVVYVIMAIVLLGMSIYTIIDPPLLSLHLCIALLAYYLFGCSTAIISFFDNYSLYIVLFSFVGSLVVSTILFCGVRYCIAKRCGGFQELRAMMFFGKDITDKVSQVRLKKCTCYQLWVLARASDKIDITSLEMVLTVLESERNKDYLQSFFNSSLTCLVAQRKETIPPNVMSSLLDYAARQDIRKRRFWESVWASDVQQIRKNACVVGKHRLILERNLLDSKTMYGQVPELVELIDTTKRQKRNNLCKVSGYEIFMVFVALLGLLSIVDIYLVSRDTTCLNMDFLIMRDTLASFSIALSDIWCDSLIGEHFGEFVDLWNDTKASTSSAVQNALNTPLVNGSLRNLTEQYLQEMIRYDLSGFADPGFILPNHAIFETYEHIFSADSDFYKSVFGANAPIAEQSLRYLVIMWNVVAVMYFIIVQLVTSRQQRRLCNRLMFISKSQICRFAQLQPESSNEERVQVPMGFKIIEWKSAKYDLLALLCALLVMNTVWYFRESYRANVRNDRAQMELQFTDFAHSDLTGMWMSFAYLMAFMGNDTTYAAIRCDSHLNVLYHFSRAEDFLALFPTNMRSIVGYLLYDEKTVMMQEEAKGILINVSSQLVEMALEHAASQKLILLRAVVFSLAIIMLVCIALPIIRIIAMIPRYENIELQELWSEFVQSEGKEEQPQLARYNPKNLPFVIIKVNSNGQIAFATDKARETYGFGRNHVFFSDIDFGFVKTTEINKALNERRYKREVITIDIDGVLTYIYPIFHSDALITDIESFVFVEMQKSDVQCEMPMDVRNIVKRLFPGIKHALPECDEFAQNVVSVVSFKIMNIGHLAETEEVEVFEKFFKDIIDEMDKIALEYQFKRITVSSGTFDFICDTDEQKQVQSVFIKTCVSFSSKLLRLVSSTSEKYALHDIYGSAVFFKGTQLKYHIGHHRCAQAGILGHTHHFATICHRHFTLNAIALATPHKPNNRITDMSKLATFQDETGKQFDLFIVVK